MPETKAVAVKDLVLDLANYRTVPQPTESAAIAAMVSTSPDRFWALTDSLLDDGYLPTESVIVLRGRGAAGLLTVKEGNRRVAALKLILGLLPPETLDVPGRLAQRLSELSKEWRAENRSVPCTIYDASDAATVDRLVALTHGKGEKAGRDQWNAIARARHNRDAGKASEPALDLLEKYLKHARNVTARQQAHWAGEFPLSVLAEAMKRLAPRLEADNAPELARAFPAVQNRDALEAIIHDIGQETLGFEAIRDKEVDFALAYGLPEVGKSGGPGPGEKAKAPPRGSKGRKTAGKGGAKPPPQPRAVAITDPRAVRRRLIDLLPRGKNRDKVETLRLEAIDLSLTKTQLAFCFVLRSMLEISAKAYCRDHASSGLSATKTSGEDRALVDVLRDVTKQLTNNNTDKVMVKALHGAMAELGKSAGLLSVTSMNQLVHNPRFSIASGDIAILFGNIFPLLEEMNR